MARVLVVGCGCRGRVLAEALTGRGHAVRGTTRDRGNLAEIEAAGAEAALADPVRLATLTPQLEGVSVLCWLMGSAGGPAHAVSALHGPRLESMLGAIVDTPVRGVVYEASGSVDGPVLERGAALARRVSDAHRIPLDVVTTPPTSLGEWLRSGVAAVERVLGR